MATDTTMMGTPGRWFRLAAMVLILLTCCALSVSGDQAAEIRTLARQHARIDVQSSGHFMRWAGCSAGVVYFVARAGMLGGPSETGDRLFDFSPALYFSIPALATLPVISMAIWSPKDKECPEWRSESAVAEFGSESRDQYIAAYSAAHHTMARRKNVWGAIAGTGVSYLAGFTYVMVVGYLLFGMV